MLAPQQRLRLRQQGKGGACAVCFTFVVKNFCYRCSICCSSFPGTPLLLLLLAMGVLKAAVKKGPVKTYPCGTPCVIKWIHYAPAHSAKRPWRVQVTGRYNVIHKYSDVYSIRRHVFIPAVIIRCCHVFFLLGGWNRNPFYTRED